MKMLKNNNSAGFYELAAELIKAGGKDQVDVSVTYCRSGEERSGRRTISLYWLQSKILKLTTTTVTSHLSKVLLFIILE